MTSIEWFWKKLFEYDFPNAREFELFEQAKEMHKQEIIDTFNQADAIDENNKGWSNAEQYYQETFVSKGSNDHISDISKMVDVPKQETLFTEEQVREAIRKTIECKIFRKHTEDEIIQSLKQPKKD